MSNICSTKWTINGGLKIKFKKKFNEPNFFAWFFLDQVKCVYNNNIKIGMIRLNYFNGLTKDDEVKYREKYNFYKKNGIYFKKNTLISKKYKNENWTYVYKDKEFFDNYLKKNNFLTINKIKKIFLNDKIVKNNLNKLNLNNNKKKINFLANLISKILKGINFNNTKIILKWLYYNNNFNSNNFKNYKEMYKHLKNNGIEKKYNIVYKNLYSYLKKKLKNIKYL